VAAPVFKEVADRIYAWNVNIQKPVRDSVPNTTGNIKWAGRTDELNVINKELNLTPAPQTSEYAAGALFKKGKTNWQARSVDARGVPDLQGLTMRDALYILENKGFEVSFRGTGKVIEQSLPAGSPISGDRKIELTLQ
jgi:cell division protein FtsI (penicillin-binding protein 3)